MSPLESAAAQTRPRFALVTPSYAPDYGVCRLAVDSARRHLGPEMMHYIIVSQEDLALFGGLADSRTQVLVQEDLVAERFWKLPGLNNWRFNLRTLPVRGWIWQQLVKLSIANRIDADVYVILDSDCFFVRPFDPAELMLEGKTPLFREERDFYRTSSDSQKWAEVGRRLLRLPPWKEPYGVGYVGAVRFWRRDVLLKLQTHLSNGQGAGAWLRQIARNVTFSEYMLYGIFVEHVLGPAAAGHYLLDQNLAHEYWPTTPMDRATLAAFEEAMPADKPLVMISAKSRTRVSDIRATFGF